MMAFEKRCCTNDSDEYWMEFILFFVYSFLHSMTSFNAFFFLQKNLNKIPNFLYMCISLLLRTIIDMDRCHVTLRVASHGKIFMHTILNIHNTNSTFCKQIRSNSWEHKRQMPSVLSFVCSFIWLKSDNLICIRLLSRSFFFYSFLFSTLFIPEKVTAITGWVIGQKCLVWSCTFCVRYSRIAESHKDNNKKRFKMVNVLALSEIN